MKNSTHRKSWDLKSLSVEAKKFSTRQEFSRKSHSAYETARRRGILEQICKHMQSAYGNTSLDKKEIGNRAKFFKTKIEFLRKDPQSYKKAYRKGWLNQVCSHMKSTIRPPNFWTYKRVEKESKKYRNRDEFKFYARGAYGAAYRENWLDDLYPKKKTQN